MNLLEMLARLNWWNIAGWTMLHYLWLGALVGVAAGVSGLALRSAGASARYATALVWLAVLAVLPIGVAVWVGAKPQAIDVADVRMIEIVPEAIPSAPGSAGGNVELARPNGRTETVPIIGSETVAIPNASPRQSRRLTVGSEWSPSIETAAVYLPWLWIVGAPLTFLFLATGVVGAERLRRESRVLFDGSITACAAQIAQTLAIGRRVTVAVCERVAAPVLVGILRPMILLPPAALTGWSPDEIEMVLLHELAHVRRWDNLVNLVQRIVEAALFFQPAVWLVSRWVRREREACCDAVVVGRTQQPHAYAELLVALAAQLPRSVLFHPAASSAMAAGPIRSRIRRVLGIDDDPMLISGKSLGVVMAGLLLVTTLAVINLPTNSKAEESSDTASTDAPDAPDDARAQQNQSLNNLKESVFAMHNYYEVRHSLPPVAAFNSAGKPLLSWRVLLLPYLGEEELYRQFRREEPWDSEHNRKLIARMPDVFKNPRIDREGFTNYLAVVGDDCVFDGTPQGIRFAQITDGTSKTIALVEADADRAVEWTKPEDWQFNREHPTDGLGGLWKDEWLAAWSDARATSVPTSEPEEKVRAYFTRRGDEVIRTDNGTRYADAFGGMGGEFGGEMGTGRGGEFAAGGELRPSTEGNLRNALMVAEGTLLVNESQTAAGPALVDVPFVVGASRFEDGDSVEIIDVRGTSDTFERGNVYWIMGRYTLGSRDRAQLSAFTTARNAGEGRSSIQKIQTTTVDRGSGEFTLWLPMTVSGWPHVSFYPDGGGNGFGGTYFGTGESVLEKWWNEEDRTTEDTEKEIEVGKMRSATLNNLRKQAIGMLNYADALKHLPPRAKFDASGKPLLSWRVLILPFLDPDYAGLYEEFHLDEPWDSEHNRKLIARMPDVFRNPRIEQAGLTNYLAVVGEECVFDGNPRGIRLPRITDGLSRTIAIVEADAERAVEWTRPSDWEFDRERPTAGLGGLWPDGWYAAWVDGSVRSVSNTESPEQVGIQFTRAGGEVKSLSESAKSVARGGMMGRGEVGMRTGIAGREDAGEMGMGRVAAASPAPAPSKFPTLEEQKRADVIWRRMGLEVEPLSADELRRVQTLGYDGGMKVTQNDGSVISWETIRGGILPNDILVGLHVWPTTSATDIIAVLQRDDLAELNPLKFYLARPKHDPRTMKTPPPYTVVTGRITVNLGQQLRRLTVDPDQHSQSAPGKVPALFPTPPPPPLTDDEKAALRERGPICIDLYVSSASEPCRRAIAMIPEYERAFPGLIEVKTINVEEVPAAAEREGVVHVPTYKLYQNDLGIQTSVGVLRVEDLEQAIARVVRQGTPRPSATAARLSERPRVVEGTAMPIPLGSLKKSTNSADSQTDEQVALELANDPNMEMMNQELMSLQVQLNTQQSKMKSRRSNESDRLQALITAKHRKIDEYRRSMRGQPSGSQKSLGLPVPNIPNAVAPQASLPPAEPIPETALPSAPPEPTSNPYDTSSADSVLRYDGKTFDQWRTAWQTELSTDKRLEAVKALAAFGRAGYGKEAAAVILDVAGEYDFTFLKQDNDLDGKFKQAVIEVLAPESGRTSLAEFWLPDLVGRMKDDPGKWRPLLAYAVGQLRSDNPQVIGLLRTLAEKGPAEVHGGALGALVRSERISDRTGQLSEEARKLLAAALASGDKDRVWSALWLLVYDANNPWALGWNGMGDARLFYLPEIVGPLLGADEEVRRQARLQLQYIQAKDTPALLEQLLKVVHDESRAAEHVEAIRAIAAMGPAAVAAMEELKTIVAESEQDEDVVIAALLAAACANDKEVAFKVLQGSLGMGPYLQTFSSLWPTLNLDQEQLSNLNKKLKAIERLTPRLEEEAKVIFPESRPRQGGGMF